MKDVNDPADDDLARRIEALAPWFHNLRLGGHQTAPGHFLGDFPRTKFERFAHAIPERLDGKSVLDIGCNAGFYSQEMKRRGAARVLGIDHDEHYLAQARFAAEVEGLDIEFRQLEVYDVGALGETFDLVIFMGVLYHLRHPLLALDLIHEHVADDLLLFQSMQRGANDIFEPEIDYDFSQTAHFDRPDYPKVHFIEHRYAGDWTNWWAPNASASAAMLRSAGFQVLDRPEEEVFLCRRTERPTEAGAVYPARSPLKGHDKTKEPRR